MRKLVPKFLFASFLLLLFQTNLIYGDEELPIITIDFVSGDTIDLDKNPQMIRANIEIHNYNPQDGYHFMQIIRLADGEIIKTTEIFPKFVDDDLFNVQILHYLEPDANEESLIGNYDLRIFSEFGTSEATSTFSVIKSSMPELFVQNTTESSQIPDEIVEEIDTESPVESLKVESSVEEESKIPIWVHEIFVWYADETISENELLTAIEYLISQGILSVNTD